MPAPQPSVANRTHKPVIEHVSVNPTFERQLTFLANYASPLYSNLMVDTFLANANSDEQVFYYPSGYLWC